MIPSGNILDLINNYLAIGPDGFARFARRKTNLSHGRVKIVYDPQKSIIGYSSASCKHDTLLNMGDIGMNHTVDQKGSVRKILKLVMVEANARGVFQRNGFDRVVFMISDLVDSGIYASISRAYAGFQVAMDILTQIQVKVGASPWYHIVDEADIKDGQCVVTLGGPTVRKILSDFFAPLPMFYFSLNSNAADLCNLIFRLARMQNKSKMIKDTSGVIYISNKLLQTTLNLPDVGDTKNPSRDIRGVISAAQQRINAINTAYDCPMIRLASVMKNLNGYHTSDNKRLSINQYLDNGYLQVTLSQDIVEALTHGQYLVHKKGYQRYEQKN